MILKKDQLSRYMKQMIIPEVDGDGQEKLMASSIAIHSEYTEAAAFALYYLAAAGVGRAYCCIDAAEGWDELSGRLNDLNSDIGLNLVSDTNQKALMHASTRIVSGNPSYVRNALKDILNSDIVEKFIPTVIAQNYGWRGTLRTFMSRAELAEYQAELEKWPGFDSFNPLGYGHKLSGYFSSLMAVQEHLKLTLSAGKPLVNALYYDLCKMEFETVFSIPGLFYRLDSPAPSEAAANTLANSKVFIAGCGGLGSSAAYSLASMGVGSLGLADSGRVKMADLNRQILHSTSRIGTSKVKSAGTFLKNVGPHTGFELYDTNLRNDNILSIIESYDIVIGCIDNHADMYMLNDACLEAGIPLLEADVMDISGLVTTIIPGEGHCYRCIFPESGADSKVTEAGVLGPVAGLLGIVQAAEAVKLLSGIGRPLKNRLLLFDAFDTDIYVVSRVKNLCCKACGSIPKRKEHIS